MCVCMCGRGPFRGPGVAPVKRRCGSGDVARTGLSPDDFRNGRRGREPMTQARSRMRPIYARREYVLSVLVY